jgi:eukaryotic-like serine/threonine-protein kinase
MDNDMMFSDYEPGTLFHERYRVISLLGYGGMATVYKVADTQQNDEIRALKVLSRDEIRRNETIVLRFDNEILVCKKLSHPNIVKIYDGGVTAHGVYFISMELLDGGSLSSRIKDYENPLQFPDSLRILRDVAAALQYAHEQKVIHRDLKPDNILFNQAGDLKIVDFGLARDMELGHSLTMSGETVGTPFYMSPEQLSRTEKLDGRTDIYALGIIAFEMVAGHRPFEGENYQAIAMQHLTEKFPRIAPRGGEIPEWFQVFVELCAQKKREKRFQNMKEVVQTLEERMRKMGLIPPDPNAKQNLFLRFLDKLCGV